jgi:hypothetical protein
MSGVWVLDSFTLESDIFTVFPMLPMDRKLFTAPH